MDRETASINSGHTAKTSARGTASVFPEILGKFFFLWALVGSHFSFVGIGCVFYALHDFSLKGVAFLEQFVNAFRTGFLNMRQSLQSARLPAGFRICPFRVQVDCFNALAFAAGRQAP